MDRRLKKPRSVAERVGKYYKHTQEVLAGNTLMVLTHQQKAMPLNLGAMLTVKIFSEQIFEQQAEMCALKLHKVDAPRVCLVGTHFAFVLTRADD